MHIRYNETLKQYEYSHTGTDTGPWTKLDLTAHSGAIPPNIAFTNQVNQFTVRQEIYNTGGDQPRITLVNVNGGFDKKSFQILNFADLLRFWALNDPQNVILGEVNFTRDGSITATGNIGIGGGTIFFPAAQIQHASANALDDYEEGTWTPVLTASSGAPTYSVQHGHYTKIGRLVSCMGRIILTSVGSLSGSLFISFPFAASSAVAHGFGIITVGHFAGMGVQSTSWLHGLAYAGAAYGDLRSTTGQVGGSASVTVGVIGNSFDIVFATQFITP